MPDYTYQHYLLQSLCAEFGLPNTVDVAGAPGTRAVYRVTCHYPQLLPPNTVATVTDQLTGPPQLNMVFENHPEANLGLSPEPETVKAFGAALTRLKFDRTDDQPNVPYSGAVLWLLERAAGGFHKAVLLSPETAQDTHAELITLIQSHFPQAISPLGQPNDPTA